jgi:hypothetical protein
MLDAYQMQRNDAMSPVRELVRSVRSKQQMQWSWDCASRGLVAGGTIGLMLGLNNFLEWTSVSNLWILVSVFAGPMLGVLWAFAQSRSLARAASTIDRSCGLKDRTSTALRFLEFGDQASSLQKLQIEDAEQHARKVDPSQVASFRSPRALVPGMLYTAGAIAVSMISFQADAVPNELGPNEVLVTQASRLDSELEELRQLQEEQQNPEVEKLLQELKQKLEELREPNVDPKEALAKLSDMEASIQEMQKELNDTLVEASLREIGEALSLSEAMSTAGKALEKGDMQKAAEELSKMEMPEMDRKTEKAVTEKLDKVSNCKNGQSSKLKEAAEKMCNGLCNSDSSKFSEGAKGLAGECKKQGNRKKLSDLLRKQCQCLGECKSECESECNKLGDCTKKGGKNAGKAASGNQAGDQTMKLATNNKMNITGQDTGTGDVETETEKSSEQEQQAVRQYRANSDKYEALKESALESESIPLGHRQTIRKYFEMIRPDNASEKISSESGK